MSTAKVARLFALACELKPPLPQQALMSHLGKGYFPIITAGARYGLGGCSAALPGSNAAQLSEFYMAGCESGAAMSLDEFQTLLASMLYENIVQSPNLSAIEQMKMVAQLNQYLSGRDSHNGNTRCDFDAVADVPMFTKTGFWPFDDILGEQGGPQGVITMLALPETGKTTIALSLAFEWRRQDIGPVIFIQTELPLSVMRMKIDAMQKPDENLWRSGVDQLIFGNRQAELELQRCIDEPDPDRLIIFDSVAGHCGQGDSPASRERYFNLYEAMMAAKNNSRMVIAPHHVKRGIDPMTADIESGAGSSAVERFSDCIVFLDKDPAPYPDGRSSIRVSTLKNRFHSRVRPFSFMYNYKTGVATQEDSFEEQLAGMEDLV